MEKSIANPMKRKITEVGKRPEKSVDNKENNQNRDNLKARTPMGSSKITSAVG